jgi:hypothetical protein
MESLMARQVRNIVLENRIQKMKKNTTKNTTPFIFQPKKDKEASRRLGGLHHQIMNLVATAWRLTSPNHESEVLKIIQKLVIRPRQEESKSGVTEKN